MSVGENIYMPLGSRETGAGIENVLKTDVFFSFDLARRDRDLWRHGWERRSLKGGRK
jgi:hypothetical protein